MTREEKIEAFTMRIDGMTYEEIGKRFGVSRQCIEQVLSQSCTTNTKPLKSVIYPNLAKFIKNHYNGVLNFYNALGYEGRGVACMYKKLKGEAAMPVSEVRKILKLSGMTFEECFQLADGATEFVKAKKGAGKREEVK